MNVKPVDAREIKVRKSNGTSEKLRFNRMSCFWIFFESHRDVRMRIRG